MLGCGLLVAAAAGKLRVDKSGGSEKHSLMMGPIGETLDGNPSATDVPLTEPAVIPQDNQIGGPLEVTFGHLSV